jgi:4-hydroxy-L-threonine phosphate dehydrogenase PdxA
VLKELWAARVTSHAATETPCIGVADLNPHAGDRGNLGREEINVIAPAVNQARNKSIGVDGPFAADTIFVKGIVRRVRCHRDHVSRPGPDGDEADQYFTLKRDRH